MSQLVVYTISVLPEHKFLKKGTQPLDPIWLHAKMSTGFVSYATHDGKYHNNDPGELIIPVPFNDLHDEHRLVLDLTVWQTIHVARNFVNRRRSSSAVKYRNEWLDERKLPRYILWWIDSLTIPSWLDASERYMHRISKGINSEAFDFANLFSARGEPITRATR